MTEPARLLVVGGSGFVGGRVVQAAARAGYQVAYTYAHHPLALPGTAHRVAFDAADDAPAQAVAAARPQVVIYTAIAPTAGSAELQHQVNVEGVRQTLRALRQVAPAARFIYISSNAVFGGGRGLYREIERPDPAARHDPLRTYALTKAAGEQAALEGWTNTIVARTSVVDGYDAQGRLSARVAALVAQLQAGRPLARFADRYLSPTLVDNLVAALLEISVPTFLYRGILHLAGPERVTDYTYALALARRLGVSTALVRPEPLAGHPTMAASARDTSLDVTFTQRLLQTHLLDVEEQLTRLFPDVPSGAESPGGWHGY
ncbi:MAG TPA: sugar nucleotide-binding protein [Chloroflexia bacterium]|jgi:dTDP-4-dehydrorhamnose reductase|nr:sugar nucleotide-binding protein [Chloroflexia bacterium]